MITSVNKETNDRDVIEIQPVLAPDVVKLFEGNFEKMASYLKAQDGKVVLLNPRIALAESNAVLATEPEVMLNATEN